jgi:hypothetical protein
MSDNRAGKPSFGGHMSKVIRIVAAFAVASFLLSGCAVNRATATVDPSADLAALKTLHVVKLPEENGGINVLIADKFRSRGYTVTTDTEKRQDVDALVTYWDKWMWDITMYLLELTITVRDPKTDYPLATGNSFHTSLTRKSPKEMVEEVVDNIFKQGKKDE